MADGVDPGLQAERTTMAWQRTVLGIGGVSALLLHVARGQVPLSVPGATGLLASLGLLLLVEARYVRVHRDVETGIHPMGRGLVRSVALGTVLLALAAIAVILGADS